MSDTPQRDTSVTLTNTEAAQMLGLKPITLTNWRAIGKGPVYVKLEGKNVIYFRDDVISYLKERRRTA